MQTLQVLYATWKTATRKAPIYYVARAHGYDAFLCGDDYFIDSQIVDAEDIADFEANYKDSGIEVGSKDDAFLKGMLASGTPLVRPKTDDGKTQVTPNLLPSWTSLYFSGQGDHRTNGIGAGQAFKASSEAEGTTTVEWIYTDQIYLVGGSTIFTGAQFGDMMDYSVVAPATETGVGEMPVALVSYGPGNVIVPYEPPGMTTIDLTNVGLVPTPGTGYWDWDEPSQGYGTITPNPTGKGGYTLFDFEIPLGRPLVNLHVLGEGTLDFLMPNITPMRVLPQWLHRAKIYNSGHTGLKVTWTFIGGRGGAI